MAIAAATRTAKRPRTPFIPLRIPLSSWEFSRRRAPTARTRYSHGPPPLAPPPRSRGAARLRHGEVTYFGLYGRHISWFDHYPMRRVSLSTVVAFLGLFSAASVHAKAFNR